MNINNISYSEKKLLIAQACLIYQRIKKQKDFKNKMDLIVSESINKNLKTVSTFELLLEQLTSMSKKIIFHDFIQKEIDRNWYEKYCSKSTYYKYKHKAIDTLVFLLFQ